MSSTSIQNHTKKWEGPREIGMYVVYMYVRRDGMGKGWDGRRREEGEKERKGRYVPVRLVVAALVEDGITLPYLIAR